MSVLNQMKGIILSQMTNTPPEIKKAITKCINAIDSALDVEGFVDTTDIDEAVEDLFKVMTEYDISQEININDIEDTDPIVIRTKKNSLPRLDDSLNEIENTEDNES